MGKARALVLTGYGINCDYETAFALEKAGFEAERVHINDIISGKERLEAFHLFVFDGGFSYGDDLGAGLALANKIRNARIGSERMEKHLQRFVDEGKLVMGICNGFQVMVKLGLLPALDGKYFEQQVSITFNDSGRFEDRWVNLQVNGKSKCVFFKGIGEMQLPVRHGEGKFVAADSETLESLKTGQQVVVQYADASGKPTMDYPFNPNGSADSIAGICDETGRVFGLMPHPEAFAFACNHPQWSRRKPSSGEGAGLRVFRNAFQFAQKKFT